MRTSARPLGFDPGAFLKAHEVIVPLPKQKQGENEKHERHQAAHLSDPRAGQKKRHGDSSEPQSRPAAGLEPHAALHLLNLKWTHSTISRRFAALGGMGFSQPSRICQVLGKFNFPTLTYSLLDV